MQLHYVYVFAKTLFNFNIRMNEDNFMCIKIKNKYYPVKLRTTYQHAANSNLLIITVRYLHRKSKYIWCT